MEAKTDSSFSSDQRWGNLLHKLGLHTENAFDYVRDRFKRRLVPDRPMTIIAFHGIGNDTDCRLRGRVLEYKQPSVCEVDSIWKNLHDSYRRFETDEVPDVVVCVDVGGRRFETTTDEEGYFLLEFPSPATRDTNRLVVALSLPDYPELHEQTPGIIFFPHNRAAFGVISDIDDTILVTHATSTIKMMRLTLLGSSTSRTPFKGVSAFYDALYGVGNPFFYVSSSPWNLFDFLDDFMRLNDIAPGPLLLRDFGIDKTKLISGPHKTHKLSEIRSLLEFYPDLPFILIGDSGQHDPEIYAQIVEDYPGRILSIYIRDIGHAVRDRQLQALANKLSAQSVDMLLIPDTLAAATHAISKGYVQANRLACIAEAVQKEQSAPLSFG